MIETIKIPEVYLIEPKIKKEYVVLIDTIEDSDDCFIKSITLDGKEVDDYIDQSIIKERLKTILLEKTK
jgi:hypothetical protein